MIKVVSFKICPFVQRVTGMLEAKNIPYELEYISLSDKPQWFIDISPTGQVPLLITQEEQVLFESDAIVEYLDDIAPPLERDITPEQRAIDRAWAYQGAKHYLTQCSAQRSKDAEQLAERAEKLNKKAFARAEKAIGDGLYFKGDIISNIDIAWLPLLHRASIIERHACYDFLADYPKVKKWQKALLETGLAEESVPVDFVETFTGFYLSDETYLGRCEACTDKTACVNSACC